MPHKQSVAREHVALAYIEALERWELPGKAVRAQFGLSVKKWERLRTELTHGGWLPATMPPLGGPSYRAEAGAYAREARLVLEAKLAARMTAVREKETTRTAVIARREERTRRMQLRREQQQARSDFSAQRRRELTEARARESLDSGRATSAVLDAFL